MAATTGLFLSFTLFAAPLFSMIAFTREGFIQQVVDGDPYYYSLPRQASAQEESTPPTVTDEEVGGEGEG